MAAGTTIPLSLSDLKATTPGANPNDRYYLTDTGKEGEFYLENTYNVPAQTPPAADDAITVNSNTISGKVYRYRRTNENGLIDVRWFGAPGDGTDQTTALQAAFATTEGTTLVFDAPAGGNFVINSVSVNAGGKVLKFLSGNRISGTGTTITNFTIDASYRDFILHPDLSLDAVQCTDDMVSIRWFGAGIFTDSWASIQKAVDLVIASNTLPKTVYFPRGQYNIDAPVIVANYNAGTQRYDHATVLLKGEDPGTNRFSGLGAQILVNFKNRFAFGFHLCKSGGLEGINIIGQYAVPSMAVDAFYNDNDFSTYGDPLCRDSINSPYAAVVIDPFRANSLPSDGGYPGNDGYGVALSTYYTKAPNNLTGSGSSGLYFKDLKISNFTVCMIQSPNGQTQNGEAMIYEDIQVGDCKLGFASCQGQEKANSYKNIVCWGTTHTVFSNSDYGGYISAGNIFVDNVNVAGAVSRFLNWSCGGWYPSYFKNVYAESIGTIGNLISGAITCTVEDSLFEFAYPNEAGHYYPKEHLNVTREISFRNCVIRIYGTGLPVIIKGSGAFHECTFEDVPVTRVEEGFSSGDTTQFYNCIFSIVNGRLGSREFLRGSINQFNGNTLYGDYTLVDATNEIYGAFGQFAIKYYKPRVLIRTAQNSSITISGTTRSFTFTSSYPAYFKVGEPVILYQGASLEFGGIITAVNTGTGLVTISYAPAYITNGSYEVLPYPPLRPFRILGDITQGSNQATDVVDGGFAGAIGNVVHLPEFAGWAVITNVSGSTYTFNNNAMITKTGATLTPPAIHYTFNSLNPYNSSSGTVGPNTVFKKGDFLFDYYNGIKRQYICISDGMFDPLDGRKAYFTLDGNLENSLAANGSIIIPAGFMVEGFILKSSANLASVIIGTTNGGTDISAGLALTANVSKVQDWSHFTDAATTIYFGGISAATVEIKTILKAV